MFHVTASATNWSVVQSQPAYLHHVTTSLPCNQSASISSQAKLGTADNLSFVKTDVTEPESVIAEAIGDADAVIVATGKASLNPADSWAVDNLGEKLGVWIHKGTSR